MFVYWIWTGLNSLSGCVTLHSLKKKAKRCVLHMYIQVHHLDLFMYTLCFRPSISTYITCLPWPCWGRFWTSQLSYMYLGSLVGKSICLEYRYCGFKSHPRQLVFSSKMTTLGLIELYSQIFWSNNYILCINLAPSPCTVCTAFLPSAWHLSGVLQQCTPDPHVCGLMHRSTRPSCLPRLWWRSSTSAKRSSYGLTTCFTGKIECERV